MSASAILSIATVAAPPAGSGTPAASEGSSDGFAAILALETAIAVPPAPTAVGVRSAPMEGLPVDPSADVGDPDTPTVQVAAPSPVWIQVAPFTLPPTPPTKDIGNVADTDAETSTVAIRTATAAPDATVDGASFMTSAKNIDRVVQKAASRDDAIEDFTPLPAATPLTQATAQDETIEDPDRLPIPALAIQTAALKETIEDSTRLPISVPPTQASALDEAIENSTRLPIPGPVTQATALDEADWTPPPSAPSASTTAPARETGATAFQREQAPVAEAIVLPPSVIATAPVAEGDLATLETEPTTSSDSISRPVLVQTARSAGNASLADAAIANLRQLPGASTGALQQAVVSQRKVSSPTLTATSGAALPVATPTIPSDANDQVAPVPAPTPVATGAAEVRNAVAASPTPIAETRLAAASNARPVVTGPETLPSAPSGEATDGAFDIAKPSKTPDVLPQALEQLVETPLDPDAAVAASPSTAPSASNVVTPGIAGASLSSLSRATIETTANLAAQITSRLAGKATRFELGLTPEGLGRVDVTLDIDRDGQLSARLAFDNPLAATELRGRVDELRRQLEDAGFTVARDALDFSSRDNPSGGERRQQRATAYADRHAASNDLIDIAPPAWMPSPSRLTPQGVDVKV